MIAVCVFFIAHVSAQASDHNSEQASEKNSEENAKQALTQTPAAQTPAQTTTTLSIRSIIDKVNPIGEDFQNEIPILDNRFRIDAEVDKVILVFFREYGSPPIVLVRPDGSKLFLEKQRDDETYSWFESNNYDMIELLNPMPGPWQALGEVLPGSRAVVIADLMLEVEPLPTPIFSGETIKQTAYLLNAGEPVNFAAFRNVVRLSIDFFSTNNPNFDNFGIGSKNIAQFEDNGLGLDEKSDDGVFTGEFELDVINGEWQPIYSIRTPLFNREQRTQEVVVLPNPVSFRHFIDEPDESDVPDETRDTKGENEAITMVEKDKPTQTDNKSEITEQKTDTGFHRIWINIDSSHIDPNSLLIEGAVRSSDGNSEEVSMTEVGDYQREITVLNSGFGRYVVSIKAFATKLDGREIVLNVPEYSFTTIELEPEPIEEPILLDEQGNEILGGEAVVEEVVDDDSSLIFTILILNFSILVLGALGILLIAHIRKRPDSHILLTLVHKLKSLKRKKELPAES